MTSDSQNAHALAAKKYVTAIARHIEKRELSLAQKQYDLLDIINSSEPEIKDYRAKAAFFLVSGYCDDENLDSAKKFFDRLVNPEFNGTKGIETFRDDAFKALKKLFLFDVRRSISYHADRTGFFRSLAPIITTILTLLVAVIAFILTQFEEIPVTYEWKTILSIINVLIIVFLFVHGFGTAPIAAKHKEFNKRFNDLKLMIDRIQDAETLDVFCDAYQSIKDDAPHVFHVLYLLCDKKLREGDGNKNLPKHYKRIKRFHRLTQHFMRWENIITNKVE